ncbi:MAG: type II secretion system protein [Candidatus Paceibacterota bacterium]|jgi:prepilin-type N-terminal cleavage/methylation domain-containing protein
MIKKAYTTKGFTLLEMLVSLGIFAIVAVIAVGALVRITGLNRQAQTLQSSMNNIGYALETMSRDMRMRSQYDCNYKVEDINWANGAGPTDLNRNDCIANENPTEKIIAYESAESASQTNGGTCQLIHAFGFFPNGTNKWSLKKAQQTSCGEVLSDTNFYSIIDEKNTTISSFQLGVYSDEGAYSRAFIRIKGYAGTREKEKSYFDIQTSVSERIGDVE